MSKSLKPTVLRSLAKFFIIKKTMYKIATWNVERPKKGTQKTALAIAKIEELNADILVLTENATSISLTELYPFSVHSLSY